MEILPCLSLLGYFLFFRRFCRDLRPAFFPALTVSLISLLVFLGGLAGQMMWTGRILFAAGLCCLVFFGLPVLPQFRRIKPEFRKNSSTLSGSFEPQTEQGKSGFQGKMGGRLDGFPKQRLQSGSTRDNVAFLWMAGAFILLFGASWLLLKNRFIYGYDDFSHWGLVARILVEKNRLPVEADGLLFPSYPPLSACFIYFFAGLTGKGHASFLLAQAVMLFSFLLSLQSIVRNIGRAYWPVTLAVPLLMGYTCALDALSVDNLLGAAFLSALLLLLQLKDSPRSGHLCLSLLLACCTLIKNSGLFLALFILGVLAVSHLRKKQKPYLSLGFLVLPLLVFFAWRLYVRGHFASFGKHYMSLSVYYGTLRGRLQDISLILEVILPLLINPLKNHALWLIPSFVLVYIASPGEIRQAQRQRLVMGGALFLLYETGILAMYLCSMGIGELMGNQGIDFMRYNGTVICPLSGLLLYCVAAAARCPAIERNARRSLSLLTALGLACFCISLNMNLPLPLNRARQTYPDASAFSLLMRREDVRAQVRDRHSFALLVNEPEASDYQTYMALFYLPEASRLELYSPADPLPAAGFPEETCVLDLRNPDVIQKQ